MSENPLSFVKMIISSIPSATIVLDFSTNEIALLWEEDERMNHCFLDAVSPENKEHKETYWKEVLEECKKTTVIHEADEQLPEKVRLYIERSLERNK